jgi:hypothetical protein
MNCLILALSLFLSIPLFAQQPKPSAADIPRVVLASYTAYQHPVSVTEWDHIEVLDFFNQSDQVVNHLRHNLKAGELTPNAQLTLAHNLKKQGKIEQAKKWYTEYRAYNYKVGQHFVASCHSALRMNNDWEMQRIEPVSINTDENEFSPCPTKDGLIFFRMSKNRPGSSNACLFDKLVAQGEEADFLKEESLKQRFERTDNIVSMDVSPSGQKVLLTKLTDQSCFNGFLTTEGMATYEADLLPNGHWQDIRPLPFNEVGHRTAYATYGPSDDIIYFASDISSGFGGFDIYKAERLSEKNWSVPQNLGPKINSTGNEITPKFNGEILSFASDYHKGLGGYDIFYSPVDKARFLQPVNAGKPINSSMDDWSLAFVDQETGYFVSNRANASANSNIYYFEDLRDLSQPKAIQVSYAASSKEDLKAVTAFPIAWSNAQVEAFTNDSDPTSPVHPKYSVQIAVISPNNNSFSRLQKELGDLDELYKIYYEDVVKIRLGSYDKEISASLMLEKIKSRGYTDAFIVTEKMIVAREDKVQSSASSFSTDNRQAETEPLTHSNSLDKGKYLLRLATYLHPDNFDASKVSGLGKISSLEKGPYTIFLLGEFDELERARQIQAKVQNRGFTNAQIIQLEGQNIIRVSND